MLYNALALLVLTLLIFTFISNIKTAYGQQNWYSGEGTQKGLLVKYRISTFDYLQSGGQPFNATIWFKAQDDKGNWKTFVIINEAGRFVTSNMTLSGLDLAPVDTDVTEEFKPYRTAIRNSLQWIGDYANKEHPGSLAGDKVWGSAPACAGCQPIILKPLGNEIIQAAGHWWNTTIMGFHYGIDSKIWVKDGFPLPIKAKVYTITANQPIPVQFEFELLEVGKSDIPPNVELPKPPLSKLTTSGGYMVELYWNPEVIEAGKQVTFIVKFYDHKKNLITKFDHNASYDILITDAAGKSVLGEAKLTIVDGQGVHKVTFESAGNVHIIVTLRLMGTGFFMMPVIEKAEFDIIVVPEFPLGMVIIMAAGATIVITVTRLKKIDMPNM